MADINLLDNPSGASQIRQKGAKWASRIVGLVLLLSLLAYGFLFYRSWSLNNKIEESQAKIDEYKADFKNNEQREELLTRQEQLKNANQLIEKHMYWSALLPELAKVTLTSAKYTTIQTNSEGILDLTITVPSYTEAEKYLQVFDLPEYNKNFSNVRVKSLTKTQQDDLLKTTLNIELTLSPELLKKPN